MKMVAPSEQRRLLDAGAFVQNRAIYRAGKARGAAVIFNEAEAMRKMRRILAISAELKQTRSRIKKQIRARIKDER